MSDNEAYWVKRHESRQGQLAAVGHIAASEEENRRLYARKKRNVADALRYINLLDLKGASVLDVGCGVGAISEVFHVLGADVYGVDASPIATKEASDRTGSHPERFKTGSLLDYDFNRQFDAVFCLDVLYHVLDDENWRNSVANLHKHTKSNGHLMIIDQVKSAPQSPAPHVRFRTRQMYDEHLTRLGITDIARPNNDDMILVYRKR